MERWRDGEMERPVDSDAQALLLTALWMSIRISNMIRTTKKDLIDGNDLL